MGNLWSQPQKRLIILRGLPGSGKSTLAKQLNETYGGKALIYSTDDYFISDGKYKLNLKKIKDAHIWNQERTEEAMKKDHGLIIINNCNARVWEAKPYVESAIKYNYTIEIMEPNTEWKNDIPELIKKADSRYSPKFIKQMNSEWDDDCTIKNILNSIEPWNKLKQS